MKKIISVDIGSTYTKGALFILNNKALKLDKKTSTPTTVHNMAEGVTQVLRTLLNDKDNRSPESLFSRYPIYFSSSARGGLKIAAIGQVPALTLKAAQLAACSAGGRVVSSYSFALTPGDVSELEQHEPDIILLVGGTDGGHKKNIIENAYRLAKSGTKSCIVYAGNRNAAEQVKEILKDKQLHVTGNVMPEVGSINPLPVQEIIRKIFIDTIVDGKGLSEVRNLAGRDPRPTPAALLEMVRILNSTDPFFQDLVLLDVGGATTDIYSQTGETEVDPSVILRGLVEPALKRTVEGDLGLRVSVRSLYESAFDMIDRELSASELDREEFKNYIENIGSNTDYLPMDNREKSYDAICARACIRRALERHSGRRRLHHTPAGRIWVQYGKDLRHVKTMILTGGYLSRCRDRSLLDSNFDCDVDYDIDASSSGKRLLLPKTYDYLVDKFYIFSLLGNLTEDYPFEAARLASESLVKI